MTPKARALAGGNGQGPERRNHLGTVVQGRLASLTDKQKQRWSPVSVEGMLALRHRAFDVFSLAVALGKVMRSDGTFAPAVLSDQVCVLVNPLQRDRVLELLGIGDRTWRKHAVRWSEVRMAHQCANLGTGAVVLFFAPECICPNRECKAELEVPPGWNLSDRTTELEVPRFVPIRGAATRAEQGVARVRGSEVQRPSEQNAAPFDFARSAVATEEAMRVLDAQWEATHAS